MHSRPTLCVSNPPKDLIAKAHVWICTVIARIWRCQWCSLSLLRWGCRRNERLPQCAPGIGHLVLWVLQRFICDTALTRLRRYEAECAGTIGSDWWNDLKWQTSNLWIGAPNNWARSALMWSLAADSNGVRNATTIRTWSVTVRSGPFTSWLQLMRRWKWSWLPGCSHCHWVKMDGEPGMCVIQFPLLRHRLTTM